MEEGLIIKEGELYKLSEKGEKAIKEIGEFKASV